MIIVLLEPHHKKSVFRVSEQQESNWPALHLRYQNLKHYTTVKPVLSDHLFR